MKLIKINYDIYLEASASSNFVDHEKVAIKNLIKHGDDPISKLIARVENLEDRIDYLENKLQETFTNGYKA